MSNRRKQQLAVQERAEREGAGAFREAIHGEVCVVCGRTRAEAYTETGFSHQAHHAIRMEILKRLGLTELLWDPRNAVATCVEPCHRQHTSRQRRILRADLPPRVLAFVAEYGLQLELEREYPF